MMTYDDCVCRCLITAIDSATRAAFLRFRMLAAKVGEWMVSPVCWWFEGLPFGKHTKSYGQSSSLSSVKQLFFMGNFQWQTVQLPEGNKFKRPPGMIGAA